MDSDRLFHLVLFVVHGGALSLVLCSAMDFAAVTFGVSIIFLFWVPSLTAEMPREEEGYPKVFGRYLREREGHHRRRGRRPAAEVVVFDLV